MSQLPIIESPGPRPKRVAPPLAACLRCLLCILIAAGLRIAHEMRTAAGNSDEAAVYPDLADVASLVPEATALSSPVNGMLSVTDAEGHQLAIAACTLPEANKVTGYRGTSNVLLILDENSAVTSARLLSSEDTPEHVEAILRDKTFFEQFRGWRLGEPAPLEQIDATTGATLTSLAIAEGIAVKLGGEKPSLRFPDDIQPQDLQLVFEQDSQLTLKSVSGFEAQVVGENGQIVGSLIRTGPLVDSIAGYQGPSEVVAAVDTEGRVTHLALRRTYDNEPYTGYLNDEPWFWKTFQNKSLAQLSVLNPENEQVEGVSGATMTSLAVADTIVAAAREYERRRTEVRTRVSKRRIHWSLHDTGTVLVLCGALVIGLSRLRGVRWVSVAWNLILVGYFGLITGNLISLAVLTGWAANGFAWRLAPGLMTVVVVSFILPVTTKRNLYCSHVCPHGAAQQLARRLSRIRWKWPRAWSRRLQWVPGITLVAAILLTAAGSSLNLAAWEPFNAYIWYVAGAGSLLIAGISLLLSAVVPMAYCRYACGIGRLLDYVRRTARSDRFVFADGIAIVLAAVLWLELL